MKPYIEEMPVSKIGWWVSHTDWPRVLFDIYVRVYEILEGRKEVERVYYRSEGDDGFVILPDLKWDETTENALVCVVLRVRVPIQLTSMVVSHMSRSRPQHQVPPRPEAIARSPFKEH